jgi:hypothetical protein|nr:MAG TPA: hypothetical protein [Inoviridae sp.]
MTIKRQRPLPPALPLENTYPPCSSPLFIPVRDEAAPDVFDERARPVVGRFRRSSKIVLRGQVKLDV